MAAALGSYVFDVTAQVWFTVIITSRSDWKEVKGLNLFLNIPTTERQQNKRSITIEIADWKQVFHESYFF